MVGTHSEAQVTVRMIGVVLTLIGVFSATWVVVTGPSDEPWAHTMVTCCGAARAYAADMEIEEPPAADFEPSRPEIDQSPPAAFERSDPSIDAAPPADFESSQPEIAQPPPADFEPSTPEIEEDSEE